MNISNKEKIMLCILGIMLVGFGYYNFVYTPQLAQIEEKSKEKADKENEYNTAMATINALEDRKSDIKILKAKITDCSEEFYPVISEEHIILELDKLLNDSGLTGSISFEPILSASVEKTEKEKINLPESSMQKDADKYAIMNGGSVNKKTPVNNNENTNSSTNNENVVSESTINESNNNQSTSQNNEENKGKNTVHYLKCSVNFKGTYENLETFLNTIAENEKKIVVNTISMGKDSLEGISGTMSLEIYAVPKIDDELESYLKWELNNTYGKMVPFSPGAATGVDTSKSETNDFVASVKSINSDLPTVIIGKSNDDERITYAYGDGNSVEDAEIILTQDGDKYYYKYKTSRGSYPKAYGGNGVQFVPVSDNSITLSVLSESRMNSDDKSGLKLKVINNTDKLVNVDISGDDKNNPRVTIDGDSNKVSVNQK